MNVVRCNQGHFYDADKFTTCPHCGSEKQEIKDNECISISRTEETVALKEEEVQLWERKQKILETSNMKSNRSTGGFLRKKKKEQGTSELEQNIHAEPITIPITGGAVMGDNISTRSQRYTVGWLVYLNGEQRGSSCELKEGNNFIGAGAEMDIQILNDSKVALKNHAKIVFEPNKQEFFIAPGETSELVYLGEDVVMLPQKLMPYNEIKLGDTKLLFVPLCGKEFTWQGEDK